MDLKSPNILLGESGIAKIADVGLARVMGSESILHQVVRAERARRARSNSRKALAVSYNGDSTFARAHSDKFLTGETYDLLCVEEILLHASAKVGL